MSEAGLPGLDWIPGWNFARFTTPPGSGRPDYAAIIRASPA